MTAQTGHRWTTRLRSRRWVAALAAGALLGLGLAAGFWLGRQGDMGQAPAAADAAAEGEREVLYWYDPMVPDQHFDKPGKSPFMDMMLVPKYADEAAGAGVSIAPELRRSLGVRTVEVERGRLGTALTVPGIIGWDLRQEHAIGVPVDAVVERLYVKAPFEPVAAGQPLLRLRAPAWSMALAEAGALQRAESAGARALQPAAQARLRALGLPANARHEAGGIVLVSPVGGVVADIAVREGQAVPPGAALLRVNGLDTVWLEAELPQADTGGIVAGTEVEARVDALPGRRFEGRIETLLPQVDRGSRSQRARIVLDNQDHLLAPGMFAQVAVRMDGGSDVPLVPSDAVIGDGERMRVLVLDAADRFVPVAVRTGRSGGGMTEILHGLEGGERVVASGQFLIDSEASLSGALERLQSADEIPQSMPSPRQSSTPSSPQPSVPSSPRRLGSGDLVDVQAAKVDNDRQAPPTSTTPVHRRCPVLYWYDPMVPDRHFDKPGKSPFMDMMLVPKFAPEAEADCTVRDVDAPETQP